MSQVASTRYKIAGIEDYKMIYAFFCRDCEKASMGYQQT
jgi:hypothetical protein